MIGLGSEFVNLYNFGIIGIAGFRLINHRQIFTQS